MGHARRHRSRDLGRYSGRWRPAGARRRSRRANHFRRAAVDVNGENLVEPSRTQQNLAEPSRTWQNPVEPSKTMLLAIDVGNTNIVLGAFDGARLAESWRLATLRERTSDELGILVTHLFARSGIAIERVSGIILSSVVPPLTRTMEEMAERYFGRQPLTVDPETNTG